MSIRHQLQPRIDAFIEDLEVFATGSYLKEEERALWEPPFDAKALAHLRSQLEAFADRVDTLGPQSDPTVLRQLIVHTIDQLEAFNQEHAGAVVEPEEREEINFLFVSAARAAGVSEEDIAELPQLD